MQEVLRKPLSNNGIRTSEPADPRSFALFPRYSNANFSLSESSSLLALGAEALDLASNSHNPTVIAESLEMAENRMLW